MASGLRTSRLSALITVFGVVTSAGCGGGGDGPGIVNAPVVVSVTVTPSTVSPIDVGATVTLSADVQVQNAASTAVTWSSSAPNVATVSQTGVVSGVAGGQATITATSVLNTSKSGSVTVTVNAPAIVGVALNSGARSIRVAENFSVTATVNARGNLPRTVTFTSSNAAAVTVSSTDGLTANVVGVAAGQATITARSTADATKTATVDVAVAGTVRITSVTPSPVSLRVAATAKLAPTVQADAGVSTGVTYQSQSAAVATVSADGTVTGVAPGQTGIVVAAVADPTQRVTVPVAVRSGVTSVALTPDRDSLRPTTTHQLTLNVVTEAGVSSAVVLSSANPAVVTIDGNVRITGVSVGQAWVRAISTVDQTVGDSTLVTVVDACRFVAPLTIGGTTNGTVTDASCSQTTELYSYRIATQTAVSFAGTLQFPGTFGFFGDRTGIYVFANITAGSTVTGLTVLAPGTYNAYVAATSASARGSFSITTAPITSFTTICGVAATTGITVTLPLNACSFQPATRPAGTYRSFQMSLLPFIAANERVTITVTATGFTPLIEAYVGSFPPITATAQPGSNVAIQSFLAPAGGGFVSLFVSSVDAGQTGTFSLKVEGPASQPAVSGALRAVGADRAVPVMSPNAASARP